MNRTYIVIGVCAVAALAVFTILKTPPPDAPGPEATSSGGAIVTVEIPPIEGNAVIGQRIFETACAACHGINAVGIEGSAPPLVHVIYEPSHHGDEAFQRAIVNGVRSHHWRFGNMPPVEGLTRGDVTMIVTYIRELQRANGIQ